MSGADLNVADAGQEFEPVWVDIADPDRNPGACSDATVTGIASGPFLQARTQGALRMARGENRAITATPSLPAPASTAAGT